jgi:predicted HicB family RNase H-like nuclease
MSESRKPKTFPLRLPLTTRDQAIEAAERDGISLNQFVTLAVAEKIARLEADESDTSPGTAVAD